MRRHRVSITASRNPGGRREPREQNFIIVEFDASQQEEVNNAIAAVAVGLPAGCRIMSMNSELLCSVMNCIGMSCSRKTRMLDALDMLLTVTHEIKERALQVLAPTPINATAEVPK